MKKYTLLIVLILAGCGTDVSYDGIARTAPGYPLSKGTHISPCREVDMSGRCIRYAEPSDLCVNPKGMDTNPPILPCPKDKDGKPIPFK